MNTDNMISLQVFLFGGTHFEDGDPYRTIEIEGWHCLLKADEVGDTYESLENFKDSVECLALDFGWCTENSTVTDESGDSVQEFDLPATEQEWLKLFEIGKKLASSEAY